MKKLSKTLNLVITIVIGRKRQINELVKNLLKLRFLIGWWLARVVTRNNFLILSMGLLRVWLAWMVVRRLFANRYLSHSGPFFVFLSVFINRYFCHFLRRLFFPFLTIFYIANLLDCCRIQLVTKAKKGLKLCEFVPSISSRKEDLMTMMM